MSTKTRLRLSRATTQQKWPRPSHRINNNRKETNVFSVSASIIIEFWFANSKTINECPDNILKSCGLEITVWRIRGLTHGIRRAVFRMGEWIHLHGFSAFLYKGEHFTPLPVFFPRRHTYSSSKLGSALKGKNFLL